MAIYNISTNLGYEIPKSTWDNGNSRTELTVKPQPQSGYTVCSYDFSLPLTGQPPLNHTCKTFIVPNGIGRIFSGFKIPQLFRILLQPDSLNGTNLTKDVMIYNTIQLSEDE